MLFGSYVTIRDPNLSIELKLVKDTNMSNDISAEATSTKTNNAMIRITMPLLST